MSMPVRVLRLDEGTTLSERDAAAIDEIFFSSSGRQSFESAVLRAAFRERWLGRYLRGDRDWFYVARGDRGPIGYLAGSVENIARSARFRDLGFTALYADLAQRYPAHLHVNVSSDCRGQGVGEKLVGTFLADLRETGVPGVHLVTGNRVRNNRFYTRQGFLPVRLLVWGGAEMLVFCRETGL